KALLATETRRKINQQSFSPEVRFLVSPIPSSKAPEVVRRYKQRAVDWISDWISPWKNSIADNGDILETDITHFVSYQEIIATSDKILSGDDVWKNYHQVGEWIERFLSVPGEKNIPLDLGEKKNKILENFSFPTGAAEQQENLLDTFVETDMVKKALSPEIPLVLGRKGTGKTAIFRRLSENKTGKQDFFIITSPHGLSRNHPLYLGADGFSELESILEKRQSEWREFWTSYVCLVSYYSMIEKDTHIPEAPTKKISKILKGKPGSERKIVALIEKIMSISGYRLMIKEWLFQLDKFAAVDTLLLFDGLDTGFGNSEKDRKRRKNALEGLFTFITENSSRLENFKFKIMLREDIFKVLKFENKSHLFGLSISLRWNESFSFFKVIIKQALRNKSFKEILEERITSRDIENWGERDVIYAWNLLVGERMKGSRTTFTRNWVWNRLADGNQDHSPRYLVQLMNLAVEWEKKELKSSLYDRSIIRPRSLIKVLPDVSEKALQALKDEEFPELEPLMKTLTQIGRTPLDAIELKDLSADLINLAM
ncbi:MAG: ParA family protein, partial [Candidatus Aminicenantes bacterium]|nr:ParA family protein [Candidatus Aminicenantes bacterium]